MAFFLCQVVKLENDLEPLLSYPSLPYSNREDNYLLACEKRPRFKKEPPNGYANVLCGDHVIAYRLAEKTVNATHLLRLVNNPRSKLTKFFATNPEINKDIRLGHAPVAGTYISFDDALILCTSFGINPELVRNLIAEGDSTSMP